jgi:hypothetical protein
VAATDLVQKLRSLTSAERRILKGHLGGGGSENIASTFLVFCIFVVVSASVLIYLESLFPSIKEREGLFLLILVLLSGGLSVLVFNRNRYRVSLGKEILSDLQQGQALVYTFESNNAALVEDFEDSGKGLFLDIGNERTLFLVGQYLDELIDQRKLPCKKFEIAYSPRAKITVSVNCLGAYFVPSLTLVLQKGDIMSRKIPDDGEILNVGFLDLIKRYHVKGMS